MKNNLIAILGLVACGLALGLANASATLSYSYSGTGQTITDGSSVGITSIATVSGPGVVASSGDNVSVTLNLTGGNLGDLYSYLSYNGHVVVLLNRPGTGGNPLNLGVQGSSSYSFAGTLADGYSTSVDASGGTSGSYQASGGATAFQTFNGLTAAGNWTLFFADLSGGDGANTTTLTGWTLNITAVPEPVTLALTVFLAMLLALTGVKWAWIGKA